MIALPGRHAGLGIPNPCMLNAPSHRRSIELTLPLVQKILDQDLDLEPADLRKLQNKTRSKQKADAEEEHKKTLKDLQDNAISAHFKRVIQNASEKGASSWVTAIPLYEHSTVLHKGDFRDAMCLRYGWDLEGLPGYCGCGHEFDVQHAMQCMYGGFRGLLHNEVVHVYKHAFKEAGYKVVWREPELQALTGEKFEYKSANMEDEARSDLSVLGFWTRMRRAFFDVTAFSPYARSYLDKTHSALYISAEKRKCREYRERILQVEHGDFSPLVFATTGGMGPQATAVTARLGHRLAEVKNLPFSVVMGWLRCRISFALLRSTLVCLRGSRPFRPKIDNNPIDLAVCETKIFLD